MEEKNLKVDLLRYKVQKYSILSLVLIRKFIKEADNDVPCESDQK